jgi:para-nitrobenzyl esterase
VPKPRAQIPLGELRGVALDGVHRYLGIPFASPPTGAGRFAPPSPAEPWTGVRNATAFGPGPIQAPDDLSKTLGLLADHPTSEDCLTLNVWTPEQRDDAGRPVLVWIHGGGFQTGMAAGPAYDGAALARRGGVVVVTLNYRVGALGFLAGGGAETANLGLQDQVAALRFVREAIPAFGGDPERVTVFGESAGAGSIVALLAMPGARGLFQRAIVQSAAPEGQLDAAEGAERAALFAAELGTTAGDIEALRALPVQQILHAQARVREPGPRRIGLTFAPVVDGHVLPCEPLEHIASGGAQDVALVIGTTAHEMGLYHLAPALPAMNDERLAAYIASRLPGGLAGNLPLGHAILQHYAAWKDDPADRFFAVETDASLFVPATRLAEAQARVQPATFMYRFTWPSPLQDGRLGACHALDVPFALGNLRGEALLAFTGDGPGAHALSERMMDAWCAFARDGDPSHPQLGSWPRYAAPRRATMELGASCGILEAPDEDRRAAWAAAREGGR